MEQRSIYAQIADRTDGTVYIGVVGPVRTGKSTFIKRFMEQLVLPNIENIYERERATDELPQSGSGRTIMTTEPKFVPEEAVEITPDGTARLSVRLIDSVGYLVDGAIGATENGQPRMVTTPWADTELPMEEAAELGTRKVMEEHSTVGLVVTTDGSITDIPRADYREAEARAIRDMQATGKPFLVVVNSAAPNGGQAQALRCELEETYGVHAVTADCQSLHEAELGELLREMGREDAPGIDESIARVRAQGLVCAPWSDGFKLVVDAAVLLADHGFFFLAGRCAHAMWHVLGRDEFGVVSRALLG